MTHSPTPEELAALKVANAALLTADSSYDFAATIVFALGSAQLLQSPDTAAELVRLRGSLSAMTGRVQRAEQRRAELEAVLSTHREDDQAELSRLRDRVAELEGVSDALRSAQRVEPDHYYAAGLHSAEMQLRSSAAPVEDPHDSPLHHTYRFGRELPEVPRG